MILAREETALFFCRKAHFQPSLKAVILFHNKYGMIFTQNLHLPRTSVTFLITVTLLLAQ